MRKVTAGPQYGAAAFHRAMLGTSYRKLWTTTIEAEELDLAAEAGGLTPLQLSRSFLALPGEWGVFAFGDAGRVWLAGETSDTWHASFGGGLWFGLLARSNAIALTVARSDERTALSIRAGFSF